MPFQFRSPTLTEVDSSMSRLPPLRSACLSFVIASVFVTPLRVSQRCGGATHVLDKIRDVLIQARLVRMPNTRGKKGVTFRMWWQPPYAFRSRKDGELAKTWTDSTRRALISRCNKRRVLSSVKKSAELVDKVCMRE